MNNTIILYTADSGPALRECVFSAELEIVIDTVRQQSGLYVDEGEFVPLHRIVRLERTDREPTE